MAKHIQRFHAEISKELEQSRAPPEPQLACKKIVATKTVQEFLKPSVRVSISKQDIKDACVLLCTVDGRPFSMMNDVGFRKILNPIIEGLKCDNFINPHNVRDDVVKQSARIVDMIKKEVDGKLIALKVDGLTHLNRSFIGKHKNIYF